MKINSDFKKSTKLCKIEKYLSNKESYFLVEKNKVLDSNFIKGIETKIEENSKGIKAVIRIKKGNKIKNPVFFCFGLLESRGEQIIVPEIIIEENAEVRMIAHCTFPHAQNINHKMKGILKIGKNSRFFYDEYHYHGLESGANVEVDLKIEINENGYYENNFNLTQGTIGNTKIKLKATLKEKAKFVSEIKTLGKTRKDSVNILEKVFLSGKNSKSIMKMRAAAKNGGRVEIKGETYAQAEGSQGHVDCQEIVIGNSSIAKAIPLVQASHPGARVTHEAAVGKINQKELEALMTKGLDEDQATEMIINAMLNSQ